MRANRSGHFWICFPCLSVDFSFFSKGWIEFPRKTSQTADREVFREIANLRNVGVIARLSVASIFGFGIVDAGME
jgi:hypothetical protein